MRRAFRNPVGQASRLAALATEPATSTRPVRRLARLLSLVLPAATFVLGVGPAAAQTVTISPTTAQSVQEGSSFSFTLTVADAGATHEGYIDFSLGTASIGDFEVYEQATAPTGSDTPITIDSYQGDYYYNFFSAGSPPSSAVTFWFLAKTDTVYVESDETLTISAQIYLSVDPYSLDATSDNLDVTLTDGPLAAPTGKPTTPANLTATAGRGAVTLIWDPIDTTSSNTNLLNDANITKHQYRQSTDGDISDETWTDIPNSAVNRINANTYTIGSLTAGTEYTFQVRAINGCTASTGCGNSDPSAAVMATPDAEALAQPTGLTATAGNTEITLTWTDPGDASIAYYEYAQKAGSAAFGTWTEIDDSTATTTSYRITGLYNGTAYSYRIRARTYVKASPASDAVTATPRGAPPAAPVLTATPRNGGVTLSWPDPVDASILRYEYQYKIGTGVWQPWQTAPEPDTSGATLQIPVGGLTNGTAHTFHIRAVNADGQTISNEATATPVAAVPAKPTGLTTRLDIDGDQRILEWDPAADPSILRYEYTTDEGRTWTLLTASGSTDSARLPEDEFVSGYTFRVRAVNAAGPGPASEPAVEEEAEEPHVNRQFAYNVRVEWNQTTKKATLVWDQTTNPHLRWWIVLFRNSGNDPRNKAFPIGTTRYELPGTFNGGDTISPWILGCVTSEPCWFSYQLSVGNRTNLVVGVPERPTGFSATAGDAQIALAWDDPMDSSITKYQYESGYGTGAVDIPDGDDPGTNPGDETSYVVTGLDNGSFYYPRLRAVNANGNGPWTLHITDVGPQAPGTPAPPSGLVELRSSNVWLTTWNDPQDPSIIGYQRSVQGTWQDIPGSDATTTGYEGQAQRLRAVNAKGPGLWAVPTVVLSTAPAQPTGLRAAPGNGRVTLTWDDPGNLREGVYIAAYRYTADGGETWTAIPNSQTTVQGHFTSYTVPNLTNGRAYTFAIQAENEYSVPGGWETGTSPVSAAVTATPRGAVPAKPTGLSAAPGDAEATLTWDDPHDASITRYQVKQGSANWADISGSDADTTSHTVASLTNGTAYTFQIRAVNDHDGDNADDPGPASDAVTVRPGVPAAPASLVAAAGDTQVTLTWTAPASDGGSAVTGYEYTSNADAAAPAWTDVPDSGSDGRADETEYTVTGLVNNTTYAFAVRAENANGQGAATPTRGATPAHPDAPQRPAVFRANPGHRYVRLTWSPPGNPNHPVTSYQYRQSTNGGTTWNPDWTAIAGSGAATAEHLLTGLADGTTYTFELRALKDTTAGPSARAQATPSAAAADEVIDRRSSGQLTSPSGSTYTVTQLSPPAGLNWSISVPGTTEIGGRTFTVRSLQGTTPETSPQYAFTSTGQEGLDIVVHPPLAGQSRVCLEPTSLLRREAGSRPLRVLRYSGTGWTPLPTTTDGGMLCGATTAFSGFVLGYAAASPGGPGDGPSGPNAAPEAATPLPPQTVAAGETGEALDLTPYFRDPDGDPLTYAAVSDDPGVVIANLPRGSSHLTLRGVAGGSAVVVVTARDPHGAEISQSMTVTVRANAAPEVAQRFPPRTVLAGETSEPLDLAPYFHDPDGDPLTYTAVSYDTSVAIAEVAEGSGQLILRGVAAGEAGVIVTARDPGGSEASQPMTVTVRANAGPAVAQPLPPQTVLAGGTSEPLDLAPYFHDPDGDPLTYAAVSDDPGVLVAEVAEGGSQLTLRGVVVGEAVVVVTASDRYDGETSQSMTVTVRTNAAPEAARPLEPQTVLVGTPGEPLDLAPYFHDPDGDPLTYTAVSDDPGVLVAEVAEGGSQLILRGVAVGEAVVVVTARGPFREHASQSMTVTVRTNAAPEAARPLAPRTVLVDTASEPLDLAPHFHDPDGDPLTYTAVSDDAGVVTAEVAEGGNQLILRGVAPGEVFVVVTASDPFRERASQSMTVTVRTNAAPEVAQPLEQRTLLAGTASEPLNLAAYFHDPDGDPLTYAAVSDNAGVAAAEVAEGDQLTLRAVAVGETDVVVTARDPFGAEASQRMTLTVRTNAAPEVAQPLPPQTLLVGTASEPLDLAAYFRDPDGDPLTYAAVSDSAGVATAEVAEGGDQLILRAVAAGEAVVVVTARDPWGGEAGQSVTVTVTAADPEWVKAWVARFGRTVSGHVLDGVQERLRAAPRRGFQATLAGHQLGGISDEAARELGNWQFGGPAAFQRDLELFAGRTDEQMSNGAQQQQQGSAARDLFTSSAFSLTVGNPEEDRGGFGAVWGRGAVTQFNGQDGALSLAGEVATGMVGFDWISGRLRTGLALAMSRGNGGYNAAAHSGDIESKLTGLFPWVGYDFTDRVSVWAAAGYGAGVLTLTPENEEAMTAELGLSMVAGGARAELLKLRQLGGVMLALETDTRLTRTTTGAIAGLDATEASVWQRRLGLEGSRPVALGGRLSLRPSVEVGLRYDGGDAENGAGMDVGAGLGFADSGTGLAVDVNVRTLLMHQAEGFSERGVALSLSYDPTPSTPLGLTARVAPEWGGQAQSGAAALWGRETMAGMAHGGAGQGYRLSGEVGYGLPVGNRFVGTPRVGFSTSEHSRDYRVGYGLGVLETGSLQVDVGVDALRSESSMQGGASNAVRGQASLGW